MIVSLSSISILPLSSYTDDVDFFYLNHNRGFNELSALSAYNGIEYIVYESLKNIKDVSINNDALIFLTDRRPLSSFINNTSTHSGVQIGYDGISNFNTYFYCAENSEENETVNIKKSHPYTNYNILVSPFRSSFDYNIIQLKTPFGINGEYNYHKVKNNLPEREYDAIYFGNHQKNGYTNLYVQYKSDRLPITFKLDTYTFVYLDNHIQSFHVSAGGFVENAAFHGDSPLNSDCLFYNQFGYGEYTNNGFPSDNFNGVPLCLWLSGQNLSCDSAAVWMERWFDPNNISPKNAFYITSKNVSGTPNSVIDVPSQLNLSEKTSFKYLRFGPKRNETFVKSFSSNLIFYIENWSKTLTDEVNNIKGFSIGNYNQNTPYHYADMNGTIHFQVPPSDLLNIDNNLSMGVWVYQDNWSCGIDTQYWGNFSNNEGYGLFFNTATNVQLITFPTTSGFIYGFNYKGMKIFEKSINQSTGVSASRIDYMVTDLFGTRWLYDSINNKIYKLDTDDLLTEVISLPNNSLITKMQINSQNELFVFDEKNKNVYNYSTNGILLSTIAATVYTNFEIDKNDNIVFDIANIQLTDNENNNIKALGSNIYKNSNIIYHIGQKIQSFNIDADNNYWIIYETNKLLKLSSNGDVLFKKELKLPFEIEDTIELNFVKEIKGNCDYDVGWIVFSNHNYVVKIDKNGNIIKRLDIKRLVNLKLCADFSLNVKGDFTGFENKRKFNNLPDGSNITSTNPAITLKMNLICGNSRRIVELHTGAKYLRGWNHLGFSHSFENGNTIIRLYVNGIEKSKLELEGLLFVDFGTLVSPFIIGGHSGKLGAKNVERSLNDEGFFVGKIDDLRIYNKKLSDFEFRGLAMRQYFNGYEDMTWFKPTVKKNYLEEISQYHLHRYHGAKSNKYNIVIKNLNINNSEVKNIISTSIRNVLSKFTPINTELNDVRFE